MKIHQRKKMMTHINQNRLTTKLIVISAVVGFIAYSVPYLLDFIPKWDEEFKFFDKFYAIGISFGFGGVLIGVSFDLKERLHFVLMYIGIFFMGLFLTFLFDTITDSIFKTRHYVLFNLIISVICLILLVFRKRSTP